MRALFAAAILLLSASLLAPAAGASGVAAGAVGAGKSAAVGAVDGTGKPAPAAGKTSAKITSASKNLALNKAAQAAVEKKLEELAAEILTAERDLAALGRQIAEHSAQIAALQGQISAQRSELDVIILQNKSHMKEKFAIEQQLIGLIASDFAYDLIAPPDVAESASNIVNQEVLKALSSVLGGDISRLGANYSQLLAKISAKEAKIAEANATLASFRAKTAELRRLQARQKSLLAKNRAAEASYKSRLDALANERSELAQTLKKLKILREKEAAQAAARAKAAKIAAQKAAEAKKRAAAAGGAGGGAGGAGGGAGKTGTTAAGKSPAPATVNHASELSHSGAIAKYQGKKLLAPLERYTLKQGFGYYTDPIYQLKIFNENVVLRSATADANVRAVADGKVVYVGETPVLEKVIIIEHAAGLHSIYAHMDKFSRLAKVGAKLRAGNVVGKVRRDLTFEMTQKSAHIDPMSAIKR